MHAGQAFGETVQTKHRGFTRNEPVELVVFFAGQAGLPITITGQLELQGLSKFCFDKLGNDDSLYAICS
jgi:hypothetical protein